MIYTIKFRFIISTLFFLFILLAISYTNQASTQPPYHSNQPITTPVSFGEGILSTEDEPVWGFTFTPDGKKIYMLRGPMSLDTIYESSYLDGEWTEPELFTIPVPKNVNFIRFIQSTISPDGNKFFLVSEGDGMEAFDIWVSENIDGEWDEPFLLEIVNSSFSETTPSIAKNGNLYFTSDRDGGSDIYISKFFDDRYTVPERLNEEINTSGRREANPFISPDESFLIFSRDGAFYISYNSNGEWSEAEVLQGEPLNGSFGSRYSPYVSPDQKYFFYVDGDIKQVDISVIGLEIN
ncbi:TolB family protein [Chengkuizengella axinellae]|uniref:Uncharacterized protein n=1 Tax=Chengkuizengella axinellae TaxID=3064388 RepID=A0ABT9IZ18_9BACL|nr:hypothetical protein [Chengkuizengella sp. 2205SS18-9]MDP5274615.1 hypothetical protein [Chengkuizengella sp. 2205SS18-9]